MNEKQAPFLTQAEAARRLNTTDKTLRAWTSTGRITARQISKTRLAYKPEDVDALAEELEREKASIGGHDSALLLQCIDRIEALESRLAGLEQELQTLKLERRASRVSSGSVLRRSSQHAAPVDLPAGALLASVFAEKYGVKPRTFLDHMMRGIGRRKEIAPHTEIDHPTRPGATLRYLTQEQQAATLDYWQRHEVDYTEPGQSTLL